MEIQVRSGGRDANMQQTGFVNNHSSERHATQLHAYRIVTEMKASRLFTYDIHLIRLSSAGFACDNYLASKGS